MPINPREDANGKQYTFSAQMMNFTAYTSPEGFACMVGKEAESTCSNMNSDITSCYNTRSYEKTVSSNIRSQDHFNKYDLRYTKCRTI